jgi:hypothetical protein
MPVEDIQHVQAILENAILNKSNFKLEHQNITASGTTLWEEITGIPLLDSQGEIIGFRGTGISITERKLAEENLRTSELLLRKQAQREKLLNQLACQIRSSLDFDIILTTAVREIHNFLQIDRCQYAVYNQENEEAYWEILKESHHPEIPDLIGRYPIYQVGFLVKNLQKGEDL